MLLNTDELVKTFESPVIVIDGVSYPTKQLSFKDYLINQKKLAVLTDMPPEEVIALIEHLCGLTGLPADKVLALPMNASIQVIVSLFTTTTSTPQA